MAIIIGIMNVIVWLRWHRKTLKIILKENKMDNDIYEVDRDDYVGFIGQLNKEKCHVDVSELDDMTTIKISSKVSGTHFCTRIIQKDGEEHYFVFHMPAKNERI